MKVLELNSNQADINRQTMTIELEQSKDLTACGSEESVRLVQITDCHLGENEGETLAGMDTDASLDLVLKAIEQERCREAHMQPHLLMATGDLANHGTAVAYRRFHSKLQALPMPSAWIPGNHDLRDLMVDTVGAKQLPRLVRAGNWALCLLDSTVPGKVGGELGQNELEYLAVVLQTLPADCHIMLCLHHQPVPVGSAWLDEQQLTDSDTLFEMLANEKRLRAVVWGHVHQDFRINDPRLPGVELIASPSTCVQFAPHTSDFKLDDNQPGYRWFNLHADGTIETDVSRVSGASLTMDLASSGY